MLNQTLENIQTPWDFVEQFYPKYQSAQEIADISDLEKILDGELNGAALQVFNESYVGKYKLPILPEDPEDIDPDVEYYDITDLKKFEEDYSDELTRVREELSIINGQVYERSVEEFVNFLNTTFLTDYGKLYYEGWKCTDHDTGQHSKEVVPNQVYQFREERYNHGIGKMEIYESTMNIDEYTQQEILDCCISYGYDEEYLNSLGDDRISLILECLFEQEY